MIDFVVLNTWLGMLFIGRFPNGRPPAWETGTAQPWPSQQEMRERRAARARGEDPDATPADDPSDPRDDEPESATTPPRPGSRKRRRKGR